MPADDGPDEWQRISVQVDLDRREGVPGDSGRKVDIVVPVEPIEQVTLPPVAVSDLQIEQQSLSFSVDQVGVPVVVKVSYFPNWEASGALGPYRIGPNMMVVVPTDTDVELTYGRSGVDWLFSLLTVLGIALCIFWRVRGDVRHAADVPVFDPPPAADPSTQAFEADQDPWDPHRFEPHGIAEEERWIRPRSPATSTLTDSFSSPPSYVSADPPAHQPDDFTADTPADLDRPRWVTEKPEPPFDPSR